MTSSQGLPRLAGRLGAWCDDWRLGFVIVGAFLLHSQRHAFSRDITGGDTAYYYAGALEFARGYDFAWSPLYRALLAGLIAIFERPDLVVAAQRVGVVVVCTALVFFIARRLLPGWLATVAAVWWVVSPINHDPFYAVHLFAFSFFLMALLASTWERAAGRSVALGFLTLLTLTLRNEYVLTLAPFAGLAWMYDLRSGAGHPTRWARYGIPTVLALFVSGYFLAHSAYPIQEMPRALQGKQAFNFSQNYAFVHAVRDPSWSKRPFHDYEALVDQVFSKPRVTMGEAAVANPRAFLEHVWTNARLTPAGMQASLFFSRGTRMHPDYRRPPRRTVVAWGMLLIVAGLSLAGARQTLRSPEQRRRIRANRSAWVLLAIAAANGLVVGLLVVPRTTVTYPLNLAVLLWACAGLGAVLAARGWVDRGRLAAVPALVLLGLVAPSGWDDAPQEPRPLKASLDRLWPYRDRLTDGHATAVLSTDRAEEIGLFLGIRSKGPSQVIAYPTIAKSFEGGVGLAATFEKQDVTLFEVGPEIAHRPEVQEFLATAEAQGWQLQPCPEGTKAPCHIALR